MRVADLLDLDWEVGVFKGLRALARAVRPAPVAFDTSRAAVLDPSLATLASLIAGEPMKVLPAQDAGGVRGRELLLPPWIDVGPDPEVNHGVYVLRTVLGATSRRLGFDRRPVPSAALDRLHAELVLVRDSVAGVDLPNFPAAWAEAAALCLAARPPLDGLSGFPRYAEELRRAALRGVEPTATLSGRDRGVSPPVPLWGTPLACPESDVGAPSAPNRKNGVEHAAPPIDELRRVSLSQKEADEQVLQHSFEKVETIEPFNGVVRKLDGADELDGELEALEEAQIGDLFRGGPDAHAVLRADVGNADVADVGALDGTGIPYDEWDVRSRTWRRDWCRVFPRTVSVTDPTWTRAALTRLRPTILLLKQQLEHQLAARAMVRRQQDGEEVDLDAVVDALALHRIGKDEPRLYQRSARIRRDFAALVLIDVSLSSDAWVGDRRVLDVCREAVLVMGEVADTLGDAFSVHAFSSVTRNRCKVQTVKGWTERWGAVRDRLGGLEPEGYTRIGAALRHATALLAARTERRRLLILLSDGRPTDYDRYEGAYGLADVRMAIRQAEASGITAHALAIDAQARESLPALFGAGGWELLPTPDQLPGALARLYGRFSLAR